MWTKLVYEFIGFLTEGIKKNSTEKKTISVGSAANERKLQYELFWKVSITFGLYCLLNTQYCEQYSYL